MASSNTPADDPSVAVDPDAPGPPIAIPDSGDTGEGGKLKMIIQLVKKCFGVKDIAAMYRLSISTPVGPRTKPAYVGVCRYLHHF
jgi:oxysterol-binding protein-related protein 9/10/11